MKRISNKVSVQSICYTVAPTQYIRIIDYPSGDELMNDRSADCSGGTVVFDDQYSGFQFKDWRAFHARCQGLICYHADLTDLNILIFKICMAEEQY